MQDGDKRPVTTLNELQVTALLESNKKKITVNKISYCLTSQHLFARKHFRDSQTTVKYVLYIFRHKTKHVWHYPNTQHNQKHNF